MNCGESSIDQDEIEMVRSYAKLRSAARAFVIEFSAFNGAIVYHLRLRIKAR
jgi:hypothetical protein